MASAEIPPESDQTPSAHRLRSNSYDRAMSEAGTEVKQPPPPANLPKLTSTNNHPDNDIYLVKWIEFNHERLPILLQNINGPCPLLALANILLLRKRISLPSNTGAVPTDYVISAIANHILQIDTTKLSGNLLVHYEQNVSDALAILPKLKTGIDVNLQFHGVDKFEYTGECIIFDLLNIQLLHGWVIDPQDIVLQKIIQSNGSSYNQLIEKMLRQKQSTDEKLVQESLVIERFLEENRSQLTHYGILQLNETLRPNQLAVLFRNNHFSTIWKNQRQLLLLVSDQGYMDHPSIVFETLNDIDNDSVFTDGYGQRWRKPQPPPSADSSRDRELAITMQNEEQRRLHQAQLQEQQRRHSQGYYPHESSKKSRKKNRHSTYDDDDHSPSCVLC